MKEFEMSSQPQISVIICTYNREKVIAGCLESIINQSLSSEFYEIIVVDNGSTDTTPDILASIFKHTAPENARLLYEPKVGLSHARNLGVAAARADFVAFIDDDARARPTWLETALDMIRKEEPDIFGGPAKPVFPDGKPDWFHEEYAVRGDMGESGPLKPDGFLIGTNIFFRKSLIIEYGGFDPALGMTGNHIAYHEETSLIRRARAEGKKIYYSRELGVEDVIPGYKMSLAFVIYSKYKAGKDMLKFQAPDFGPPGQPDLAEMLDTVMTEFDTALMNRDESLYPYPENYLFERVRHQFFYLGTLVEYMLRNRK